MSERSGFSYERGIAMCEECFATSNWWGKPMQHLAGCSQRDLSPERRVNPQGSVVVLRPRQSIADDDPSPYNVSEPRHVGNKTMKKRPSG